MKAIGEGVSGNANRSGHREPMVLRWTRPFLFILLIFNKNVLLVLKCLRAKIGFKKKRFLPMG